jgi:uncharacterized BrkB/YihY/UPF0761 family membrane protein
MAEGTVGDQGGRRPGRIRTAIVGARDRSQDVFHKVEAARPRSATIDTGFRAAELDRQIGGGIMAGALAYRLFLWLLPLALVLVGLIGALVEIDPDAPQEVGEKVGLSAYITQSVAKASGSSTWVALLIGISALYLTSTAAYKTLRAVHMFSWQMPITPAKNVRQGGLAFLAITCLLILGTGLVNGLRDYIGALGFLGTILLLPAYAAAWIAISKRLPHPDIPWTALIPGALLVAVGAQVIHVVTVYYLSPKISRSSEVYGPLGLAAVLLLWIYIISRLVVGSAELNAVIWNRRKERDEATTDQ